MVSINELSTSRAVSNSNGSLNNPPPEDQYSTDNSSRQFVNGGIGNDWAYFGTFPNSNTGLTPAEALVASTVTVTRGSNGCGPSGAA